MQRVGSACGSRAPAIALRVARRARQSDIESEREIARASRRKRQSEKDCHHLALRECDTSAIGGAMSPLMLSRGLSQERGYRCRVKMTSTRQSRPDSDPGFQVKVPKIA